VLTGRTEKILALFTLVWERQTGDEPSGCLDG